MRLAPISVGGVLRPDLDHRLVPLETMAAYLGVCHATVHNWRLAGAFPVAGLQRIGSRWKYRPAICCQAAITGVRP